MQKLIYLWPVKENRRMLEKGQMQTIFWILETTVGV